MSTFSVGDKVSFIHDKLNGTVQQLLGKNQVLVELEDGFSIPVNTHELVLVRQAANSGDDQPATISHQPQQKTAERICIAFTTEESRKQSGQAKINVHLVNETPNKLLFTIFASGQKNWRPIAAAEAEKYSAQSIISFPVTETDSWREWQIQVLRFPQSSLLQKQISIYAPLEKCFKLKPANLLNATTEVPILKMDGYIVDLLENSVDQIVEDEAVIQQTPKQTPAEVTVKEIVDLHISAENENNSLAAQIILQQQLEMAQKAMENAIVALLPRLILIHGVGSGTLKMELQKLYMRNKNVSRWEEADPKKFGYGATAVYFKYR